MTKFIIVRHGESEANRLGVLAGHSNYQLTDIGRKQAAETAAHLASEQIDAVYASDLSRAVETAKPHAALRGLSVVTSAALREVYCGEWEGRSIAELREKDADRYIVGFVDNFMQFTLPNGERVADAGARMMRELVRIANEHGDKTVLIASHGGTIRCLFALLAHMPFDEVNERLPYPSNSSYSIVYCDGETLRAGAYSNDSHLTNVTTFDSN